MGPGGRTSHPGRLSHGRHARRAALSPELEGNVSHLPLCAHIVHLIGQKSIHFEKLYIRPEEFTAAEDI